MITTAREYFTHLASGIESSRFAGLHGVLEAVIDNRDHWRLHVADGKLTVEEKPAARTRPDCTLESSEQDFVETVNGQRNLLTSVMRGRVHVAGDLTLAQAFNSFVRAGSCPRPEGVTP